MLNRSQIFNYITLILAIGTICFSVLSIVTKFTPIVSIILMFAMLIFSNISKKSNKKTNKIENIHAKDQVSDASNIKIKAEEK